MVANGNINHTIDNTLYILVNNKTKALGYMTSDNISNMYVCCANSQADSRLSLSVVPIFGNVHIYLVNVELFNQYYNFEGN